MADLSMPSWSKRTDAGEGRDGDGAKRTKAPTREEKLAQLLLSVGKQSVFLEKAQREVANTVIRTFLSPADGAHAEAGTKALQAWQDEVSDKVGQAVGSPHVPVGLAAILALMKTVDTKSPEDPHLVELKKWWAKEIQGQGPDESHEQIRIFRVSTPKTKSQNWSRKGKGKKTSDTAEPADYVKFEFSLEDKVAEKNLCRLMIQEGGVQKTGPAPANREARIIKDLLKELE
jgi:hypothetical protein